jgi:hypothetical protein
VLEDCLLDMKPEQDRYLLSMADTMRIIDGASPITVWREKRGLTLAELASTVGFPEIDLAAIERVGPMDSWVANKLAVTLDVLPGMLALVKAASSSGGSRG